MARYVNAVHPDGPMSDKVKLRIIDVATDGEFAGRWLDLNARLQSEFGWDLPLWTRENGPAPKKHIEMTFNEYVKLVQDYIAAEDAKKN
jgi:hypothetical protein